MLVGKSVITASFIDAENGAVWIDSEVRVTADARFKHA
jgi:hypothetical protein